MPGLRGKPREYWLVFLFCAAVVAGPALATLFEHDLTFFPDCRTYLGLAHLDFQQNPVRRYRVIVPLIAGGLNFLFGGLFGKLAPAYFAGDFPLFFSFFIVNTLLTALFGLLIYRFCRAYGVRRFSAIAGVLAMLTCRYTLYMAGLPLVDSLFCVVVALSLLAIKTRRQDLMLLAIFIGPFAKESFIFIAPLLLFFGGMKFSRALGFFLLSGLLVAAYRYSYNCLSGQPAASGLVADLRHLPFLIRFLPKLFSVHTLAGLAMNFGLWICLPIGVILHRPAWGRVLLGKLDRFLLYFMVSVVVQMLLSGSLERMFYLSMPLICLVVALAADEVMVLYEPATD